MKNNREQQINILVDIAQRQGRAETVSTPAKIDALLRTLRIENPSLSKLPDEDVLAAFIEHLKHSGRELEPGNPEVTELYQKGKNLLYSGKFDSAQTILREAEKRALNSKDVIGLAWTRQYLGRAERDSGNPETALTYYESALELAQQGQDSFLIAVLYDQIGTTHRMLSDFDQAEAYYLMALSAHPRSASFVKGNLAQLAEIRGDKRDRDKLSAEVRRIYQEASNERGLAVSYYDDAKALLAKESFAEAATAARKAYQLAYESNYVAIAKKAKGILKEIAVAMIDRPYQIDKFIALMQAAWGPGMRWSKVLVISQAVTRCLRQNRFKDTLRIGRLILLGS